MRNLSVMTLLMLGLLLPGSAEAAARYSAQAIGQVGFTELDGVSNSRIVIGTSFDMTTARGTAFEWKGGGATSLPHLPGGDSARANGISPSGEFIVGEDVVNRHVHAVLWHDGVAEDLGLLPGGDFSGANAVNDVGVVVGIAGIANCPPSGGCHHAVVWGRRGVIHDLGVLHGDGLSTAEAINGHNTIVGWSETNDGVEHPTIWRNRQIRQLPTLGHVGEAYLNMASGINDHGTIVGVASRRDRSFRAVFWRHSRIHRLATPPGTNTVASAINERGAITGVIRPGRQIYAVRWTPQHRLTRLTRQLDTPGWRLRNAIDINDHGWIVGEGNLNGGEVVGYLLRPTIG